MTPATTSIAKSAARKTAAALLAALALLGIGALAGFAADKIKDNHGTATAGQATQNAGKSFGVSGNLSAPLALGGAGQPLNVSLVNPNAQTLVISEIRASVSRTSTPACGPENFTVVQTSDTVSVPPRSTRTLDQLGAAKPRVVWVNSPTTVQNGCLGAELTFSYTGKGTLR
jgi:hypothetical protein